MADLPPGWKTLVVDLVGVGDKAALLDRLASAAAFPDWAGRNWDAAEELLRDLSWWPPPAGWLVVLEGEADARQRLPDDLAVLDSVFAAVAEAWSARGTPFVVTASGAAADR